MNETVGIILTVLPYSLLMFTTEIFIFKNMNKYSFFEDIAIVN